MVIRCESSSVWSLQMTAYIQGSLASAAFSTFSFLCRYAHVPGIYTKTHIERWQDITKATKEAGAVFFCQLWHVGRSSHAGNEHLIHKVHCNVCTVHTAQTITKLMHRPHVTYLTRLLPSS